VGFSGVLILVEGMVPLRIKVHAADFGTFILQDALGRRSCPVETTGTLVASGFSRSQSEVLRPFLLLQGLAYLHFSWLSIRPIYTTLNCATDPIVSRAYKDLHALLPVSASTRFLLATTRFLLAKTVPVVASDT
jgi:hypothetical protein